MIATLVLIIVILVLTGLVTKCSNCNRWFSLRRYQYGPHRDYICKHCGRKEEIIKKDGL